MVTASEFRPDDQKVLDAMLAVCAGWVDSPLTIEGLVERWRDFVADLRRGRRFSNREYERAVSDRALLEELDVCLSADGRQKLLAAMLESDRSFLTLTVPVNGQLRRPWWQRVPQD